MDCVIEESVLSVCAPETKADSWTEKERIDVSIWLEAFSQDNSRKLSLDQNCRLWSYYQAFGDQNQGLLALQRKLDKNSYRFAPVPCFPDGSLRLGEEWRHLDEATQWAVGVAQHRPAEISVVNAACEHLHVSSLPPSCDIQIEQILEAWLNEQITARRIAGNTDSHFDYHIPPRALQGPLAAARYMGAGTNGRKAWELDNYRYEFDRQHNTLEVYERGSGEWVREVQLDGILVTETGGEGRIWGKD